jgi:hypothetical protein
LADFSAKIRANLPAVRRVREIPARPIDRARVADFKKMSWGEATENNPGFLILLWHFRNDAKEMFYLVLGVELFGSNANIRLVSTT